MIAPEIIAWLSRYIFQTPRDLDYTEPTRACAAVLPDDELVRHVDGLEYLHLRIDR
jgi:hypothetical protein